MRASRSRRWTSGCLKASPAPACLDLGLHMQAHANSGRAGQLQQTPTVHVRAALNLDPSFAQQHMLLSLHVWMLLVRLRAEGDDGRKAAQLMYEEFTEDVEARLRRTGVKVCAARVSAGVPPAGGCRPHIRVRVWAKRCRGAGAHQQAPDRAGEDVLRQQHGLRQGGRPACWPGVRRPPQPCPAWAAVQALQGQESLSAAVLRNVFDGDASRKRDAGALARYVQWWGPPCLPCLPDAGRSAPLWPALWWRPQSCVQCLQPALPGWWRAMRQGLRAQARWRCRELACLAKTEGEHVLNGKIKFSSDFEAESAAADGSQR